MNYRSREFLVDHIRSILDFYHPSIIDGSGGYFQNFLDDGTVFDPGRRHLVSSTRIVINYSRAYRLFGDSEHRDRALHGLQFVERAHWDEQRLGYNWTLEGETAGDQTNHCYGLAFVLLMYAELLGAGLIDSDASVSAACRLLDERFWLPGDGLYADEAAPDWSTVSDYRGQNANMHTCEAMLAAFDATRRDRYLERAYDLARKFAVELAAGAGGLVWEHYTSDLDIDWDYNRDDPRNLYRPWGFQPGHQTEWAKLLLTLHSHRPEEWMVERAAALFDRALAVAWDEADGGILYGFDPDGNICDDEKYFWVQAETIAAAARLALVTQESRYWQWYDRIWAYADEHMIDHRHGAWYRVLDRENRRLSNEKTSAGAKCDYHTIGACWDVIAALDGFS